MVINLGEVDFFTFSGGLLRVWKGGMRYVYDVLGCIKEGNIYNFYSFGGGVISFSFAAK